MMVNKIISDRQRYIHQNRLKRTELKIRRKKRSRIKLRFLNKDKLNKVLPKNVTGPCYSKSRELKKYIFIYPCYLG